MKKINDAIGGIQIRISGLSNGMHEYHFSVTSEELMLGNNFNNGIEIESQLEKSSRQLLLKTVIHASAVFQCDRCLKDFNQKLNAQYIMFYVYNEDEACKYESDEVSVISPDTVFIDITEDVRQMVMLSVPLKLLCDEDCKGLCPGCGNDLNISACTCVQESTTDPRWQGLKKLLTKR